MSAALPSPPTAPPSALDHGRQLLCRHGAFLVAVAAILIVPGINLVGYWETNPLYGYGLWVPLLAVFLAWRNACLPIPEADGPERRPPWAGPLTALIGCAAVAPVLRAVQLANPDWRLLDWALATVAVSAIFALGTLHGGATWPHRFRYPTLFLLTAVPWPMNFESGVVQAAVKATATVAVEALWLLGVPTAAEGRTLMTHFGAAVIADDCGGIRSFQLAVVSALFWAGLWHLRGWRRWALLGGAFATAGLFNLARVVVLILAAEWRQNGDLIHDAHDFAGQLAQWLLLIAVPVAGWLLRPGDDTDATAAPDPASDRRAADAGLPTPPPPGLSWRWAAVACVWLAFAIGGPEIWYAIRQPADDPAEPGWTINVSPPIAGISEKPIGDDIRRNYRYSAAADLEWRDERGAPWSMIWLGFGRGDLSACTHNVHRPDVCLPTAAFALAGTFPDLPVAVGDRQMVFQHQLYRRGPVMIHLFFAALHEAGAGQDIIRTDWSYGGRLRAAWLGVRSRRADLVHLSTTHPYQPVAARVLAADYLKKILGGSVADHPGGS